MIAVSLINHCSCCDVRLFVVDRTDALLPVVFRLGGGFRRLVTAIVSCSEIQIYNLPDLFVIL